MNRRGFKKNSKCEKVHWLAAASTDGSQNTKRCIGLLLQALMAATIMTC